VTARTLLGIFDSVYLVALASWVGSTLFFSFEVAPILFRVQGPESGARIVRALFPRYYLWGVISCALALPSLICGPLGFPELRGAMVGIQAGLILLGLGIMLYGGNTLARAINSARDEGLASSGRFDRLLKRSLILNIVALAIGIALLVGFASRKAPRSSGIEERSAAHRPVLAGSGAAGVSVDSGVSR
jgi:hypothetical protein